MEELAASDPGTTGASSAAVHRAEATAEFVYGTTAVIIALSGLEIVGGVPPESAALLTIAGAAAIWLCHAYAAYLGAHVVHGQAHATGEILGYLRRSAPIVLAAISSVNRRSTSATRRSVQMNRFAATQLCPELINRDDTHVFTADSRSASSRIT